MGARIRSACGKWHLSHTSGTRFRGSVCAQAFAVETEACFSLFDVESTFLFGPLHLPLSTDMYAAKAASLHFGYGANMVDEPEVAA